MTATYSLQLVALSLIVAIFASYTALELAGRVSQKRGRNSWYWLVGGAISMGIGIWSMHFIGMLAFHLPVAVAYDAGPTMLSMAIAILVSGLALSVLKRPIVTVGHIAAGGTLMGFGISAMHYTGMYAMRMSPPIEYDPPLFIASIGIAIAASFAALWIAMQLRQKDFGAAFLARLGSSTLMGLAITGMHYTGMAAARFAPGSFCLSVGSAGGLTTAELALTIGAATIGILVLTLAAAAIDAHGAARTVKRALEMRNVDLEQAMLAKNMFLANMSHELRTPLNAIIGFTSTLLMKLPGELNPVQEEQLTVVKTSARHLLSLINDLLDLSKIESGKIDLAPESISCQEVAHDAIASLRPMAEFKKLALLLRLPHKEVRVIADRRALHQILLNLCNNAIKFTDSGSVTIELKEKPRERQLEFSVADTGIGIQPEYRAKLFQAFSHMESTDREGTGLGLHLSRRLAQMMGGTIDFESQLGHGSRFWLTLPQE